MLRATSPARQPLTWHHRYTDGEPYVEARGRYAPRARVEDRTDLHPWVVHLFNDKPDPGDFLRRIVREMKIRFYQPRTIRSYTRALAGFMRWLNAGPHEATRADVRDYLELLVDGGASASWVSVHLSVFRTAFDKMCGQDITLGLQTPRRSKNLPTVLSTSEVMQLLRATRSLRDKLLLGTMYATGVRVSEVVRLRYRDFDFDRSSVRIWQGKGRKDRDVMLPQSFRPLLEQLAKTADPGDYIFPARETGRHLSPRTVQRVMERAVELAGIAKRVTPHSLRHYVNPRIMLN